MQSETGDLGLDRDLAYAGLRVILGLNIALHGITRVVAGPSAFAAGLVVAFAHTALPAWAVRDFALALPWAEAVVGSMVLFGAASRFAYVFGMVEIALLTLGSTLRQDWNAAGLQLTYALIYAVLLAMRSCNRFSIDSLLRR
jgi:thiosulfate dehydrogenase [quinone] large subunit